jgi:lipopolysaccharide export system protein LptA
VAVADRVNYNATNELVTLTGSVILDTPQASVSGDSVIYNLKTGNARVNAHTSNKVVNIIGLGSGGNLMGSNAFAFPIPGAKQPPK